MSPAFLRSDSGLSVGQVLVLIRGPVLYWGEQILSERRAISLAPVLMETPLHRHRVFTKEEKKAAAWERNLLIRAARVSLKLNALWAQQ